MPFELKSRGDDACVLIEKTASSSNEFPLPFSAGNVIDILNDILLLGDTDKAPEIERNLPGGVLRATRMREAIRLHHGSASFDIRWWYIGSLIADAQ